MRVVRLNLICILGATLGVLSFFLPWVSQHLEFDGWTIFRGSVYLLDYFKLNILLQMIPLLFIIGTIVSFVTPLGFFLQLPPIMIILYMGSLLSVGSSGGESVSTGWFLGLISCAVILFSMTDPPLRTGNGVLIEPSRRIRTFEIVDEEDGGITREEIDAIVERKRDVIHTLTRSLRNVRSIVFLLAIILSLITMSVMAWWSPTSQIRIFATVPSYMDHSPGIGGPPTISIFIDGNLSFSMISNQIYEWPIIDRIIQVLPGQHNISVDHNAISPLDGIPEQSWGTFLSPFEGKIFLYGYGII